MPTIGELFARQRELESMPTRSPDEQEELTRIISVLGSDIDLKTFRDDVITRKGYEQDQDDLVVG